MEYSLDIAFFDGALGSKAPSFGPASPCRVELVIEGDEQALAVELFDVHESSVRSRPAEMDVDYSHLQEGLEFFVRHGREMVGRGRVCGVHI